VAAEKRARKALGGRAKPEPPPTTEDELDELINAIVAAGGKARGFDGARYANPKGLGKAELARLKRPGDKPLAPTMARWLAFDATWLPLFKRGKGHEWNVTTVRDFFRAYAAELGLDPSVGDDLARGHDGIGANSLVIVLPPSAKQDSLLAIDKSLRGETPIFIREKENLFLKWEEFGEFLVDYLKPDAGAKARAKKKAKSK
jgi:hypothetical protein